MNWVSMKLGFCNKFADKIQLCSCDIRRIADNSKLEKKEKPTIDWESEGSVLDLTANWSILKNLLKSKEIRNF